MKRIAIIGISLLLLGVGCSDLNKKISVQNPFITEEPSHEQFEASSHAIELKKGLNLSIRPTFLGITGTVNDILATEDGLTEVEITEADQSLKISWSRSDETNGTLNASKFSMADSMTLPAFWDEGDQEITYSGIIWLSSEVFEELTKEGQTEWGLGLSNNLLGTTSDLLRLFRSVADKIFEKDNTQEKIKSPFTIIAKGDPVVFPLRVNGKIENVSVILAEGWFANYVILNNPQNPLILKVNINPLAIGALDTFKDLGVDTQSVGYEVTTVSF